MSETHARVGMWAGLATGGMALLAVLVLIALVLILLLKDAFLAEPTATAAAAAAVKQEGGLDDAARVLRERALTAMRDGDYDRAVNLITEAVMMAPGEADLKELLTIAIDLRDKAARSTPKAEPEEAPEQEPEEEDDGAADAAAAKPSPRAAPKCAPAPPPPTPQPKPPPVGMAVITSIPKARVEIDGFGGGSTPFRAEDLPVGSHVVSFFVDGEKVHTTTVRVGADAIELMDVDLAPYLKADEPEPEPTPGPPPRAPPGPRGGPPARRSGSALSSG